MPAGTGSRVRHETVHFSRPLRIVHQQHDQVEASARRGAVAQLKVEINAVTRFVDGNVAVMTDVVFLENGIGATSNGGGAIDRPLGMNFRNTVIWNNRDQLARPKLPAGSYSIEAII